MKPRTYVILNALMLLSSFTATLAQTREVRQNTQYWLGYMTSTTISDKYSIWNDFHFVPEGFAVARTGLTRHFNNVSVTAGYAILGLPPGSGNTSLKRIEHRPWSQIQFTVPVTGPYTLTQRLRYDARFREAVANGEVLDGYTFNHRVRFLTTIKRTIGKNLNRSYKPYVSVSNEVLLNFGREIAGNTFDQNRVSIAVGVQKERTQYQLGFMNRFVQTAPAKFTLNHTIVFWVTQKFDIRKHRDEK